MCLQTGPELCQLLMVKSSRRVDKLCIVGMLRYVLRSLACSYLHLLSEEHTARRWRGVVCGGGCCEGGKEYY
jgi:hypothetical protein